MPHQKRRGPQRQVASSVQDRRADCDLSVASGNPGKHFWLLRKITNVDPRPARKPKFWFKIRRICLNKMRFFSKICTIADWLTMTKKSISCFIFTQMPDYLKNIFLLPKDRVRIISHHLAHAASTFYTSGFKKSAIIYLIWWCLYNKNSFIINIFF